MKKYNIGVVVCNILQVAGTFIAAHTRKENIDIAGTIDWF